MLTNDVIWSLAVDHIPPEIRCTKRLRRPVCVGVAIWISPYSVFWKCKEEGVAWDGPYFRGNIIQEVHQWVTNGNSGIPTIQDVIAALDCAPGWKANETQALLTNTFGIDNFIPATNMCDGDISRWPGNSPDMNVVENFGEQVMDAVEAKCDNHVGLIDVPMLQRYIEEVLTQLRSEPQRMQKLIDSFFCTCQTIVANGGKPLKYLTYLVIVLLWLLFCVMFLI